MLAKVLTKLGPGHLLLLLLGLVGGGAGRGGEVGADGLDGGQVTLKQGA